jgi:pimeloyl-ACP methyl ester carboxylesterase
MFWQRLAQLTGGGGRYMSPAARRPARPRSAKWAGLTVRYSQQRVLAVGVRGTGRETAVELSIDPASFHDAFAGDVPEKDAAILCAAQRPVAAGAFDEPNGPPAWKKLPSWAVVATGDKAAGADVVRSMAQRAKAQITEVEGSHVIMISQPQVVADTIMKALQAVA